MDQHSLPLKVLKKNKRKWQGSGFLSNKGQFLMEGMIFGIFLLSFFISIQFFQSLARKEIQEERLAKQKKYRVKKASWFKSIQYKE